MRAHLQDKIYKKKENVDFEKINAHETRIFCYYVKFMIYKL